MDDLFFRAKAFVMPRNKSTGTVCKNCFPPSSNPITMWALDAKSRKNNVTTRVIERVVDLRPRFVKSIRAATDGISFRPSDSRTERCYVYVMYRDLARQYGHEPERVPSTTRQPNGSKTADRENRARHGADRQFCAKDDRHSNGYGVRRERGRKTVRVTAIGRHKYEFTYV